MTQFIVPYKHNLWPQRCHTFLRNIVVAGTIYGTITSVNMWQVPIYSTSEIIIEPEIQCVPVALAIQHLNSFADLVLCDWGMESALWGLLNRKTPQNVIPKARSLLVEMPINLCWLCSYLTSRHGLGYQVCFSIQTLRNTTWWFLSIRWVWRSQPTVYKRSTACPALPLPPISSFAAAASYFLFW